jgi:RNA polymerase sigma-70 factor (ECF subfamily)
LNHFLSDARERATAGKRGGGQHMISLDDREPEERYRLEIADDRLSPEKLFERRWAQTILEQALDQLRAEFSQQDKGEA